MAYAPPPHGNVPDKESNCPFPNGILFSEVLTKRIVELQNIVVTFTQSQNQQTEQSLVGTVSPANNQKTNGQLKVPQSSEGFPQNDVKMTAENYDEHFLTISSAASNLALTNSHSSPCLQKNAKDRWKEGQQEQKWTEQSPLMGGETA